MDIAALISSFSNGTFTVTRTARGDTVRGRIGAGTTSSVSITAAWHPVLSRAAMGGKNLMRLPEGRRTTESRVLYTATQLYAGGKGESYEADRVSIDSRNWEVSSVEVWADGSSSRIGYCCIVEAVDG